MDRIDFDDDADPAGQEHDARIKNAIRHFRTGRYTDEDRETAIDMIEGMVEDRDYPFLADGLGLSVPELKERLAGMVAELKEPFKNILSIAGHSRRAHPRRCEGRAEGARANGYSHLYQVR